jgi:CRP/FNR family cyclic AMP-dependent transcriptional regulator
VDYVELLLATYLFQDLSPAALGALLPAVQQHRLAQGAYFYRVGEPSTHLWLLISGQAKMSMPTPDGNETVLDVIAPGQLFGLPGLFASTNHRVGGTMATQPSVALSIDSAALATFLEHHPAAMRRALTRLADLAREYAQAMMLAAHEDLRGRVARRLLDLAGMHGSESTEGIRISVRVSQETLGAMIGATRSKVNRALADLAADGHLRIDGGVITLLDPLRLCREHPDWSTLKANPAISRGA